MGKQRNKRVRKFLLSFFGKDLEFDVVQINGFVLTKHIQPITKSPYVQIFTPKTYNKPVKYKIIVKSTENG